MRTHGTPGAATAQEGAQGRGRGKGGEGERASELSPSSALSSLSLPLLPLRPARGEKARPVSAETARARPDRGVMRRLVGLIGPSGASGTARREKFREGERGRESGGRGVRARLSRSLSRHHQTLPPRPSPAGPPKPRASHTSSGGPSSHPTDASAGGTGARFSQPGVRKTTRRRGARPRRRPRGERQRHPAKKRSSFFASIFGRGARERWPRDPAAGTSRAFTSPLGADGRLFLHNKRPGALGPTPPARPRAFSRGGVTRGARNPTRRRATSPSSSRHREWAASLPPHPRPPPASPSPSKLKYPPPTTPKQQKTPQKTGPRAARARGGRARHRRQRLPPHHRQPNPCC
jgi:hypothetical protein